MIEYHYRRWMKAMLWLGVLLAILYFGVGHYYRLAVNLSDSVSGRLFLIAKGTLPARGELVAFTPPPDHLWVEGRGYVPPKANFIKLALGMPGDQVLIQRSRVFIEQHDVGTLLSHSADGRVLHPISSGVIPAQHYFMGSYHERSYDSRYQSMGLVPQTQIMGRAYRLF